MTLNAPNRVDGAELTLTVDTALVSTARQRLRRILFLVSLVALGDQRAAGGRGGPAGAAAAGLDGRAGQDHHRGQPRSAAGADPDRHRDRPDGAGVRRDAGRARGGRDPGPPGRGADPGVPGRRGARAADADHRRAGRRRDPAAPRRRAARRRPGAPAGAAGPGGAAGRHPDLRPARGRPAGCRASSCTPSRCRWGSLAAHELDRVRLLHPRGDGDHRERAGRGGHRRRRQGPRHPAQRGGQRGPGRRAAGPDPPQPLRRRTASRCSTSGTPDRACRRASGSGSSSGWSGSTTAGAPTPAAPGLGLAIARGYARAHGGDLVCLDPGGPGALFRLTLPLP